MSSSPASNDRLRAGIVGVSGYSGMELARLLAGHPRFSATLATSDRWAGRKLGRALPLSGSAAELTVVSQEEGQRGFGTLDVLFLCTPPEASLELAPRALAAGA